MTECDLRQNIIVRSLPNPNQGVNPSSVVTLENGMQAILKLTPRWRNEIAAFKVSQYLWLNLIPLTAIREIDGKRHVIQRFIFRQNSNHRDTESQQDKLHCLTWLLGEPGLGDWVLGLDDMVYSLDHEFAFGTADSSRVWNSNVAGITSYLQRAESHMLVARLGNLIDDNEFHVELSQWLTPEQTQELNKRTKAILQIKEK